MPEPAADPREPEPHWFEELADHMGPAYLRYSFTRGTRQEVAFLVDALGLSAGSTVLDVGCGPGRHAVELAEQGIRVVGVDISERFVAVARDLAEQRGVGDLVQFHRADARKMVGDDRFDGLGVDAAISLCQGAFGLAGLPDPDDPANLGADTAVLTGMRNALGAAGRIAVSAFSSYFQVRWLEEQDNFDAASAVNHETTEVANEAGEAVPAELWTTCYTPRTGVGGGERSGFEVDHVVGEQADGYYPSGADTDSHEFLLLAHRRRVHERWHFRLVHASEYPRQVPCPSTPKSQHVSDTTTADAQPQEAVDPMGDYIPRQITENDLGELSLDDAYAQSMVDVADGQLVTGTVVKVDRDEVLLDIGYKSEGVIPSRELSIRNEVDPGEVVSLGDEIEALVLQKEDKEGRLVLSKKRAQYERAWGTIEKIKEEEGVVSGPVIEVVKGGLILDIGLRGFLPASLVELRRVRDLQPYIGRDLEAKIIELDKNRNNVVLSRRAYLEETQKEQREDFLTNLKPGERRKGTVSSVVNFGAFVDLGGMDGLIHVSELSWKHVDHPGSVVTVGDEVDVEVLEVDHDRERISLSLKATQQDPWQEFASNHQVGELVYGRVTKLVPFGSFIQVGDGIEGLVHISEMSAHHVDLPEQVVTPGEELWVKIIDLDLDRRRISLSIKQAAEGGIVAAEYQEHFGEHAYDDEGNYIGGEIAPDETSEGQEAWAEYYAEQGGEAPPEGAAPAGAEQAEAGAEVAVEAAAEPVSDESGTPEAPDADAAVDSEAPEPAAEAAAAEEPGEG